jgi:hypothetical protein
MSAVWSRWGRRQLLEAIRVARRIRRLPANGRLDGEALTHREHLDDITESAWLHDIGALRYVWLWLRQVDLHGPRVPRSAQPTPHIQSYAEHNPAKEAGPARTLKLKREVEHESTARASTCTTTARATRRVDRRGSPYQESVRADWRE